MIRVVGVNSFNAAMASECLRTAFAKYAKMTLNNTTRQSIDRIVNLRGNSFDSFIFITIVTDERDWDYQTKKQSIKQKNAGTVFRK